MALDPRGDSSRPSAARPALRPALITTMVDELPRISGDVLAAIIAEVPSYSDALGGRMGQTIRDAVQVALRSFLDLAGQHVGDPAIPMAPVVDASYALGRGEARSGRSMDALLAAYRVGARVSFRELAVLAVAGRVGAEGTARLAELVFAYIDELSAASAAGHADELETSGRVRDRLLEHLADALLEGGPSEAALALATRADWTPPTALVAVLVPPMLVRRVLPQLDPRSLRTASAPGLEAGEDVIVLLVPADTRTRLMAVFADQPVVIGPARPWTDVAGSFHRALRARRLGLPAASVGALDTETHLVDLIVGADPDAMADLRAQVLAPLAAVRPGARDRLIETLRAHLVHQGRREAMAAALFVHPQTVRYRMTQLRALMGEQLDDPEAVVQLTLALARPDRVVT
jgi:hypothetical protein